MQTNVLNTRKIEYKWVIAAMCFLMVFAGLGFCSSAKSLYIAAITDALGFSRSAFSINDSCRFITTAIANVFFGAMVTRFGTKRLIGAGMLCLIISSLLYSFATTLSVFYLGGIFLGLGVAWTTTTMVGVVINRWFTKNKGTILGAVLASNGFGAAVAIHITTPIIYQEGNPFGYQDAYLLVSLILAVVMAVIMIFYKENPPVEDLHSDSEEKADNKKSADNWEGFEFKEVLKKPYFYALMASMFFTMLVSPGGIVTPHLTDVGLDPDFVASSFSMLVIVLAVSKFLIGFVYDKLGLKTSINICLVTGLLSNLALFFITNSPIGKILTIAYSILSAVATPIQTVMLPILMLDMFGQKSYNKTLGILVSVTTAGQALGTPLMNISYDLWNSYMVSFAISMVASVIIAIVLNMAMFASSREKRAIKIQ